MRFLILCALLFPLSPSASAQDAPAKPFPCLESPEARAFDFWLGHWDVFQNGNKVGENQITMAPGGCALHESYTTPGSYSGQSINYYDPIDKIWKQHWVGSAGDITTYLQIVGGDGDMQFAARHLKRNGTIVDRRMTFTRQEDGSVRQLIEDSSDGGATWTTAFDGIYRKKE